MVAGTISGPGNVSSKRAHSSCQTSVSSKPAISGPASTMISVSSLPHAFADVVLGALAERVLATVDAAQPAQPSTARRRLRQAAHNHLEPNAVAGVQRHAEPFRDLGELAWDDELVRAVGGGCAHDGRPPPTI